MTIEEGDIWTEIGRARLLLISTNSTVTQHRSDGSGGELVMGRGLALEAKVRYPKLPAALGALVEQQVGANGGRYGVLISAITDQGTRFGAFQVKRHWKVPAELDLIRLSCEKLAEIAPRWGRIVMNYPGIGNGRLQEDVVQPILDELLGGVKELVIYRKVIPGEDRPTASPPIVVGAGPWRR